MIAFGPTVGNCFVACLLNTPIARENMADICKAVDNAFIFQREMDDYGKLFSIIEGVAKWFPELSGFKAGRDTSVELYNIYKVFNIENYRLEYRFYNVHIHFFILFRKLSMNKFEHMMQAMNVTSSICILPKCETVKKIRKKNHIIPVIFNYNSLHL